MENTRFENIDNKDCLVITKTLDDTDAQTAAKYGFIFTALKRGYEVMAIGEIHGTLGTDGAAVTLQLERLTGTTAKGSGTNILVTAFDLKSTINTPVVKETTALQNRQLARGDRLALKTSGTLTALKDVHVTIYLKPLGKGNYKP